MQPSQQLACNGAPGIPKPGAAPIVSVTMGMAEAILTGMTGGVSAFALAVLFAGLSFDLGQLCGEGDPGDPGMTLTDWTNAINYAEPQLNIPAVKKARQWFVHAMFPVWCDCSDGSSPPPNSTIAPPTNSPPPGTPSAPVGGGCWNATQTSLPIPNGWDESYMNVFPVIPTPVQKTPPPNAIQTPLPSGFTVTVQAGNEGSTPIGVSGNINLFTSGGVLIGASSPNWQNVAPGTSYTTPYTTIPTNAAAWNMALYNSLGGGALSTNTATITLTIYCQGQSPTTLQAPCCPPDPSVDLRLGALFDMMQQLLSLQALKGAYQPTITHAGLSGDGTITINPASSAIRVDITSDLSHWPNNPQTPTYFYSLGFITPYAVGTPLKGSRVVYNHQTFTWPSYTDQIGYALAAGVTANIVELTQGA